MSKIVSFLFRKFYRKFEFNLFEFESVVLLSMLSFNSCFFLCCPVVYVVCIVLSSHCSILLFNWSRYCLLSSYYTEPLYMLRLLTTGAVVMLERMLSVVSSVLLSVVCSDYSELVCYYTSGTAPTQPDPPMLSEQFVTSLTVSWIRRPTDDVFTLQMEDEATVSWRSLQGHE